MKKFFLFLLIVLTIFAFASCKQDPQPANEPTPSPEPEPGPEPIVEPGVLFVRPAEGCTWDDAEDKGKFQFKLADVQFNANEAIALYAKFSDDVTEVAVRQAGGGNVKFKVNGSEYLQLTDLETDEEGWYIISIPAESVVPTATSGGAAVDVWTGLGISVHLPDETKNNCFVAFKGLKLGDEYFDVNDWDEEDCAQPYYNKPSELDITLTLPESDAE